MGVDITNLVILADLLTKIDKARVTPALSPHICRDFVCVQTEHFSLLDAIWLKVRFHDKSEWTSLATLYSRRDATITSNLLSHFIVDLFLRWGEKTKKFKDLPSSVRQDFDHFVQLLQSRYAEFEAKIRRIEDRALDYPTVNAYLMEVFAEKLSYGDFNLPRSFNDVLSLIRAELCAEIYETWELVRRAKLEVPVFTLIFTPRLLHIIKLRQREYLRSFDMCYRVFPPERLARNSWFWFVDFGSPKVALKLISSLQHTKRSLAQCLIIKGAQNDEN